MKGGVVLRMEDAAAGTCPWSGKPVSPDAPTLYEGAVAGFCNPGFRDMFQTAVAHVEAARNGSTQNG